MAYNPFLHNGTFNPIIGVDGVRLPVSPTKYEWVLEDLSNSEAGRTEDGVMHKNRIGQIRGLKLEFKYLDTGTAQKILFMFNPEYVRVEYIDPLTDPYYGFGRISTFYTGDRTCVCYNASRDLWESITFNLIEQYPGMY